MAEKARIDRTLIASLRESSRPLRPEASLTSPPGPSVDDPAANARLQQVVKGLLARVERVEQRLREMDRASLGEAEVRGHVLFVPAANGYAVVERDGPPPRPGDEIEVDGNLYRAERYRRSPLPADRRACVIIEAAETG